MSFDPKNYPPNWTTLVAQVHERARNLCEHPGCSVPNGIYIVRDKRNHEQWHEVHGMEIEIASLEGDHVTRVVLTTHHACDCDKRTCVEIAHFQLLCQLHHLRADLPHHIEVRRANREAKRLKVQPRLLEVGA